MLGRLLPGLFGAARNLLPGFAGRLCSRLACLARRYGESPRVSARPTTWGDDSSLPSSSRRGNCPATILLELAVLYIHITTMYNAAMYSRVSSLALRWVK